MTTYATPTVVCAACGCASTRRVLTSTNAFGSPDLDSRPPEMKRSTMDAWVQRCPSCGFCAPDLTKFDEQFRVVISGDPYRAQLVDTRFPATASGFLCWAMLAESVGRQEDAGWASLDAAWVLDDARKDDLARSCRSRAADIFLALIAEGESILQPPGASQAIVSDCLRRAGRGADALQVIERASTQNYDGVIQKALAFQKTLIQRGDTASHLIKEAVEAA